MELVYFILLISIFNLCSICTAWVYMTHQRKEGAESPEPSDCITDLDEHRSQWEAKKFFAKYKVIFGFLDKAKEIITEDHEMSQLEPSKLSMNEVERLDNKKADFIAVLQKEWPWLEKERQESFREPQTKADSLENVVNIDSARFRKTSVS